MSLPSRLELESQLFGIIKTLKDLQEKVEGGHFSFQFYHDNIKLKIREILLIELIFKQKGFDLDNILDEMDVNDEILLVIPKIKNYILFKNIQIKNYKKNPTRENHEELKEISELNENPDLKPDTLEYLNESDFQMKNQFIINKKSYNPLKLAKISAEITALFITIIDLLKLKLTNEFSIFFELGRSLYNYLSTFPGMDELSIDISMYLKEIEWLEIIDVDSIEKNRSINGDLIIYSETVKNSERSINIKKLLEKFEKYYTLFKTNILKQIV